VNRERGAADYQNFKTEETYAGLKEREEAKGKIAFIKRNRKGRSQQKIQTNTKGEMRYCATRKL